jgi:REP element-mobilizing transposase RayT
MTHPSEITDPSEMKRQSEITDLGYSERVKSLSRFIQQWKQWTSKRILRAFRSCSPDGSSGYDGPLRLHAPIWQAEFFDHLLRSEESYAQKWQYVRENPVRKRLVKVPDDWPWQGEVYHL